MQQHVFAISQTCAAHGIRHVVICPGSRSAPLVFAFTRDPQFHCYSVVDERSAAYMALGMAQQLGEPVALICTSGTATLNFFPAIAEAFYQRIPLLVLTADRPPELLNQQDGQMIDQVGVFGKHVLASVNLPCYPHGKENRKETVSLVSAAIAASSGDRKGPVHVNVPLKEPLYPQSKAAVLKEPITVNERPVASAPSYVRLAKAWKESKRKMILLGQLPVNNELFSVLYDLNKKNDVVLLCDVLSNQQSLATVPHVDFIISAANEEILKALEPDLVLSFGGPVLSKAGKIWLKKQKPTHHFRIGTEEEKIDTYNNVTAFLKDTPESALRHLIGTSEEEQNAGETAYVKQWKRAETKAAKKIAAYTEGHKPLNELFAVNTILKQLPVACNLQLANSSVIRYVSNLGELDHSWTMNGNRGTSGIDGCTSTAVGAAIINNRITVLLTGDLGFLYDRNALWNRHVPDNLRIIVLNNNGGGIFTLIDGPSAHPEQLQYFTTPAIGPGSSGIKNAALENGLDYYFCDSQKALEQQLQTFFNPRNKAAVLEVKVNMRQNAAVFKAFKKIKI